MSKRTGFPPFINQTNPRSYLEFDVARLASQVYQFLPLLSSTKNLEIEQREQIANLLTDLLDCTLAWKTEAGEIEGVANKYLAMLPKGTMAEWPESDEEDDNFEELVTEQSQQENTSTETGEADASVTSTTQAA